MRKLLTPVSGARGFEVMIQLKLAARSDRGMKAIDE